MTTTQRAGRITVHDAELHAEVLGAGPVLLLVPGAGGDGGQYAGLAAQLMTTHTVVTYDRRNCSRSSRLDGWENTSIEQQADDASALLSVLGLAPATVFGNSTGALIALATALRSPESVTSAVLHEPTLISVLADPDGAMSAVQPVIAAGMESGGYAGGAEAFLKFAAGPAYDTMSPELQARMIGNAEVLFEAEFGPFMSWAPDAHQLATSRVPIAVLNGEQTAPFFREAASWVATQVGTDVVTAPGGHMGFLDDPAAFATAIRPLLPR